MTKGKYRQSYGCCSGMSEDLIQPGGGWKYPVWYLNYILGRAGRELNGKAKKVLDYLSDGLWKMKVGAGGIGVGTIEALVELEMIEMRPIQKKGDLFVAQRTNSTIGDLSPSECFAESFERASSRGGFIGAYRITKRGRETLVSGFLS